MLFRSYLKAKRVDLLIEAVGMLVREGRKVRLLLVGMGSDEHRLRQLAGAVNKEAAVVNGPSASYKGAEPGEGGAAQRALECVGKGGDPFVAEVNADAEAPPVVFESPVAIAKVRQYMRRADVYVLPSSGYEGWGTVVNEAMAEGCAVVVSDAAGSGSTLIRHGENGFLFKSGDVRALAKCLRSLADEPALGERLGATAHDDMVELWTPAVAAERFLTFSKACADGAPLPVFKTGPLSHAL